ncbi:ACP S-malonyltransferase [bacterium]|nr:ACP S-malonyltransferase [bacterium]
MPRVPMIFPGQASQSVGMARDLYEAAGPARDFLLQIDDALGVNLTGIMFDGPGEVLTETRNAQPAILAHSVAVALALRERGIAPSLVAGHSLGEFSAAVASGALSPLDGLRIVRRRGELMFAAGARRPGTMAAVMGLDGESVASICAEVSREGKVVVLANHNSAAQVAISGEPEAVAEAGGRLTGAGARRVIPLDVSGAFHSPLLDEAAEAFAEFLREVPIADPEVPLLANVSASPVTRADDLRRGFAAQLTAPVLWHDTMESFAGAGSPPAAVLEVGPGKVLTNLARRAYPAVKFIPVGTVADLDQVAAEMQGTEAPRAREAAGS